MCLNMLQMLEFVGLPVDVLLVLLEYLLIAPHFTTPNTRNLGNILSGAKQTIWTTEHGISMGPGLGAIGKPKPVKFCPTAIPLIKTDHYSLVMTSKIPGKVIEVVFAIVINEVIKWVRMPFMDFPGFHVVGIIRQDNQWFAIFMDDITGYMYQQVRATKEEFEQQKSSETINTKPEVPLLGTLDAEFEAGIMEPSRCGKFLVGLVNVVTMGSVVRLLSLLPVYSGRESCFISCCGDPKFIWVSGSNTCYFYRPGCPSCEGMASIRQVDLAQAVDPATRFPRLLTGPPVIWILDIKKEG